MKTRPANFDNSFLGVTATQATLFDCNDKIIGYCLDTPNNVAYAFGINNKVKKAEGILGVYDIANIASRINAALTDKIYHSKYVKFN